MSYQPASTQSLKYHFYYFIRIEVSLIVVELIMIALFRFYPVQSKSKENLDRFSDESNSSVVMEDVVITEQKQSRAVAPPVQRKLPPEPTDELIEMEPLDISGIEPINDSPIDVTGNIGMDNSGELDPVSNPDIPPQLRKIVEPVVPAEARKANIKARIRVSFLISEDGYVEDLSITKIEVYDKDKEKFVTKEKIGYGLAEAAMKAASKWQFGPAEDEGRKVPAVVEHIFTFGFN